MSGQSGWWPTRVIRPAPSVPTCADAASKRPFPNASISSRADAGAANGPAAPTEPSTDAATSSNAASTASNSGAACHPLRQLVWPLPRRHHPGQHAHLAREVIDKTLPRGSCSRRTRDPAGPARRRTGTGCRPGRADADRRQELLRPRLRAPVGRAGHPAAEAGPQGRAGAGRGDPVQAVAAGHRVGQRDLQGPT